MKGPKPKPVMERLMAKVVVHPETGCWDWTGAKDTHGYGHMHVNGRLQRVHRLAFELFVSPIPAGLWVLHRCDRRHCVSPEHLFLGTHDDNMNDAKTKGRMAAGENNGAAKHPERIVRGNEHWTRRNPDKVFTGDKNPMKRYPHLTFKGEKNAAAKLTAQQVIAIRNSRASAIDLARQFMVTAQNIKLIQERRTWKHLIPPPEGG